MSAAEASTNETNRLLGVLRGLKYQSDGEYKLLRAVCKTYQEVAPDFDHNADNRAQVRYAQKVWNNTPVNARHLFLPKSIGAFMTLAGNENMTAILTAALDAHNQGSGDAGAADRYNASLAKYTQLKAIESNQAAFAQILTRSQEAFIERFEARIDPMRETTLPNQNAVTYVYILLKFMKILNVNPDIGLQKKVDFVKDALKFFEMYGDQTVSHLKHVYEKLETIMGPESGVDLKGPLGYLLTSEHFVTAVGEDNDSKYLDNSKLTMKRVYRCVKIFINSTTAWGLLDKLDSADFVANINTLFQAETAVGLPDKKSLAMIWYFCIGRQNMSCVMVDHHSKNAANELARILGTEVQSVLPDAAHAFPFNKSLNENFEGL